jgi:hypothetical protein
MPPFGCKKPGFGCLRWTSPTWRRDLSRSRWRPPRTEQSHADQILSRGWLRLLRAADRYADMLWKHCLFCRDCLERERTFIYSWCSPCFAGDAQLATPCQADTGTRSIFQQKHDFVGVDQVAACELILPLHQVVYTTLSKSNQ